MVQHPRKHARVPFEDQTFVKMVTTTNPDKMVNGKTFIATILDLSVRGLRVTVPCEMPIGSRVEVWVKSTNGEGTLKIKGRLAWCRAPHGTDGLQAGIEIRDYDHTDFKEYQRRIAKLILPEHNGS